MPVTHRVLPKLDLVHSVWSGVVTMEEARGHNEALLADPDFHPAMKQLSDARSVESEVSGLGVRGLARHSAFGPLSRRAIVAPDDVIFGISRMYQAQATDAGEIRVFRRLDEALEWLEVDAEELGVAGSEG
jgi:hypothetical protein